MSSSKANLEGYVIDSNGNKVLNENGYPIIGEPKPRPSKELAEGRTVYYTEPSSGKITYQWKEDKNSKYGGKWKKIN